MLYKTMVLRLLEERPELYDQLRSSRTLMQCLENCSVWLRRRQQFLKAQLAQAKPGSDPSQIASEAAEIALKELEDTLPPVSNDDGPLSLDDAMAFLRRMPLA